MMKKLKNLFLFILLIFTIVACSNNNLSTSKFLSSSSSSSETKKEYLKDEEGFYILEDDYFKPSFTDDKKISKVKINQDLDKTYCYSQMRMYIGPEEVPLLNVKTNISQIWNGEAPSRMNNAVGIIELEGKINIKIQTNFAILGECIIRPLSAKIQPEIDENRRVISFDITSNGQYTIELRSGRTLHLFVNKYEEFKEYKENYQSLIYFGKGIHNKDNSKYINQNNLVNLDSNTTVYLELGAIVQAGFFAVNKNNIKIVGSGVVDGSIFDRSVNNGTTKIPYEFNYCSDLVFKGVTTLDPAGWCYNLYFGYNIELDNIKIISSRSNGDGVSCQSCQNLVCKNSFVRSWDDSLVVKNYPRWEDRSKHGTSKNILFENCLLWTDLAQSMEVGYETVGEVMEDIVFNNITVLHNYHKAVISIHNANNAKINNVHFTNITVEDLSTGKGDGKDIFIDIANIFSSSWSTNHTITSLGSISNVEVNNVLVLKGNENPLVNITGTKEHREEFGNTTHYVNDVLIQDVLIQDKVLDQNYTNLNINLANNINFERSSKEILGADIPYLDTSSYGNSFEIIKL